MHRSCTLPSRFFFPHFFFHGALFLVRICNLYPFCKLFQAAFIPTLQAVPTLQGTCTVYNHLTNYTHFASCILQATCIVYSLCKKVYSRTSDSGHTENGTLYCKPLNKGHWSWSQITQFPIVFIQIKPPRRGQPLYKGQNPIVYIGSQSVLCSEVPLYP